MQEYNYKAKDKDGKVVHSTLEASSVDEAAKLLIANQLFPISVSPVNNSGFISQIEAQLENAKRVKSKDKVILTRQLATLVKAGLPIAKSLQVLTQQTSASKLNKIMQNVTNTVQGGSTLAKAMASYPDVFDSIYINMIEAGEISGNLEEALLRLADQEEKNRAIRSKIRGALTYPVVVFAVLIGVTILMVQLVIPQVANIYIELNQPLPYLTKVLVGLADFSRKYWYIIVLGLIGLIYGGFAYLRTDAGKAKFDQFKLNMPVFKIIVRKVYMARFARTMSSLINSGISVLQALKITADAINNVHLENAVKEIAQRVKSGDALSKPIINNDLFLPLVGQMIEVGEQTGTMGDTMNKVAEYFEDEVDEAMSTLSTLIEPLTMVILGVMVAFLIAAVLLPIYGLVTNIT